jgi:pyrroloquinoline-quinone synthase
MNDLSAPPVEPREPLDSADAMERRLRWIGATRYHALHPFHRMLHGGQLTRGQVQAWALNRYCYQSIIPIKDAVVISRFRDRMIRLEGRDRTLAEADRRPRA